MGIIECAVEREYVSGYDYACDLALHVTVGRVSTAAVIVTVGKVFRVLVGSEDIIVGIGRGEYQGMVEKCKIMKG